MNGTLVTAYQRGAKHRRSEKAYLIINGETRSGWRGVAAAWQHGAA